MADDRYLRFHLKMTVNGILQIDGYFTAVTLSNAINEVLTTLYAPTVDFRILYRAKEGYHLHNDMVVGKSLIAYEILSVADPDGHRQSRDPVPVAGK